MRRITPLAALSALAALLSACDDKSPTSPGTEPTTPPAALGLELPDTLTAGRAFTLAVEALDESGDRDTNWSGTVTLAVSAGAISPATLTLVSGHASTEATLTGSAGEVTITATAGSGQGAAIAGAARLVLSGNAPARLVLEPSSFLLTEADDSAELRVIAYDDADQPTTLPTDLAWRSLRPEVIEVEPTTAEGDQARASAASASGSAQIVVEADGIVSDPALGLIATPAADAVLVSDSQVSGTI